MLSLFIVVPLPWLPSLPHWTRNWWNLIWLWINGFEWTDSSPDNRDDDQVPWISTSPSNFLHLSPLNDPENSIFLHHQAFGAPFVYYYCLLPRNICDKTMDTQSVSPGACYRARRLIAEDTEIFNIKLILNNLRPLLRHVMLRRKRKKLENMQCNSDKLPGGSISVRIQPSN